MEKITSHPMFRLFFDLTVNQGWNLTAMMTYALIVGVVAMAIIEKRKGY